MPKVNRAAKQSSKKKGTKKNTTTKVASEPVREADVAVTTIRMLHVPTPDAPRFDPEAPIENFESDSDEGSVADVDLNYEDDYLCQDLAEDSDDNKDGNEETTTMKDSSFISSRFSSCVSGQSCVPHNTARITMALTTSIHRCYISRVVLFQLWRNAIEIIQKVDNGRHGRCGRHG